MKITLKKARREVKNPLYGRKVPEALVGSEVPQEIKRLWSQKELRISAPTAEILPLQARLRPLLKRAWPVGSEKDISWMTADLAGLWEVSRAHIILVKKLLRVGGEFNRDKLQQIAIDLDINWYVNARGHMETLKHELARFRASLHENARMSTRKRKAKGTRGG
jgi:hypothetical protein